MVGRFISSHRQLISELISGTIPKSAKVVNPLRRSCVSDARNLGETAIVRERGQPSAEIVRVECVKCRLCHWGIGMH